MASAMILVCVAACSQFQVRSDYDRRADFTNFRTYAWTQPERRSPDDLRVDAEFLDRQVLAAANDQLGRKGYREVAEEQADFLVTYRASVKREIDSSYVGGQRDYGAGLGPADDVGNRAGDTGGLVVEAFDEGTLTIMVLPRTGGSPMWWGSARAVVFLTDSEEKRGKRLRRAVEQIIKRFPPS